MRRECEGQPAREARIAPVHAVRSAHGTARGADAADGEIEIRVYLNRRDGPRPNGRYRRVRYDGPLHQRAAAPRRHCVSLGTGVPFDPDAERCRTVGKHVERVYDRSEVACGAVSFHRVRRRPVAGDVNVEERRQVERRVVRGCPQSARSHCLRSRAGRVGADIHAPLEFAPDQDLHTRWRRIEHRVVIPGLPDEYDGDRARAGLIHCPLAHPGINPGAYGEVRRDAPCVRIRWGVWDRREVQTTAHRNVVDGVGEHGGRPGRVVPLLRGCGPAEVDLELPVALLRAGSGTHEQHTCGNRLTAKPHDLASLHLHLCPPIACGH